MSRTLLDYKDAFSSGQIGSKIWLCEELEKLFTSIDSIYIYGSWLGVLSFLLRSRNNIRIKEIRNVDIDETCESVSDMINENWVWKNWATKAVTMDCNDLVPVDVDLVINTSTEHFESKKWFENIPVGTIVALQSNNMEHDTHISNCRSLDDFLNEYPLTEILYKGTLAFEYPDWKFERYMVIGQK